MRASRITHLVSSLVILLTSMAVPVDAELIATWTFIGQADSYPIGPGNRGWYKSTYDPVRQKVVVWGGGGSGRYRNDLWHYDTVLNEWTEIEPLLCPVDGFFRPLGRDSFGFVYDEVNDVYWLHGGGGYKCAQDAPGRLTGIAEADSTGALLFMSADVPVQAANDYLHFTLEIGNKRRYVTSYDPIAHAVVLDSSLPNNEPGAEFEIYAQRGGGTQHYDPSTGTWTGFDAPYWDPLGPQPASRKDGGFVYSAAHDKMVLFGGISGRTYTWVLDAHSKTWTETIPHNQAGSPPARGAIGNGMVYDSHNDVVVLFGGVCKHSSCAKNEPMNDTWTYDISTNTWAQMSPAVSPPRRRLHMMSYDEVNHVTVLFGGKDENGDDLGDLWAYDHQANTWTELTPTSASPIERRLSSLVYDSDQNIHFLYGGAGGKTDMWKLSIVDDGTLPPNVPPTAAATVGPEAGDTTVEFLFDGSLSDDSDGTIFDYLWDFGDGNSSTEAVAAHTYAAPGTYDATLTVTDNDGESGQAQLSVTVDAYVPPPQLTFDTVTVRGTVDDPSVTEVLVDGVSVPVIGGEYEFTVVLTGGSKQVTIEATNAGSATTTEVVTITAP